MPNKFAGASRESVQVDVKKLLTLRGARTQEAVADDIGISLRTLQNVESGRKVTLGTVKKIAEFYDVSPNELLLEELPPQGRDATARAVTPAIGSTDQVAQARECFHLAIDASSGHIARTQLLAAARRLTDMNSSEPNCALLLSKVYSRLARMEASYQERFKLRQDAIEILSDASDPDTLTSLANAVVDYYHDRLPSGSNRWIQRQVSATQKKLVDLSKRLRAEDRPPALRVMVLAQSASLQRCRFYYSFNEDDRQRCLGKLLRITAAATDIGPEDPIALLSSGQGLWHNAMHRTQDEHENRNYVQRAEADLIKSANCPYNLGCLVLAQFYRARYEPEKAIEYFRKFEDLTRTDRQMVLANANLVGQAARNWWYRTPGEATAGLDYAFRLLQDAFDAGYRDARTLTNLAFVERMRGKNEASEHYLMQLAVRRPLPKDVGTFWQGILELAKRYGGKKDTSDIRDLFAFGFDTGENWNALATYLVDFGTDGDLPAALSLYETASLLSPKNSTILFNRARMLRRLDQGQEAKVYYEMALNRAGPLRSRLLRRWWKAKNVGGVKD